MSKTMDTISGNPSTHWRWNALLLAALLWGPFAWVVAMDYPWNSYRWLWISLWPILPGFLAGTFFHPNDALMFLTMGITTATLAGILLGMSFRGFRWKIAACAAALAISIPSSLIAYAAFRV